MVIDYLFRVVHVHAAVTDLDGVSVEDFLRLNIITLKYYKYCNQE